MNILVITYYYFPELNPRAFRWTHICGEIASGDNKIDVVTNRKKGTPDVEVINGVRIFRTGLFSPSFTPDKNVSKIKGPDNSKGEKNRSVKQIIIGFFLKLIKGLYNNTWKKIYWPDSVCYWYFFAISKSIGLIKKNRYDRIITVSHPFTSHLVGLHIKKRFPDMFWLADSGDPFCFSESTPVNNYSIYSRLNYKTEEQIFRHADALTFTTEGTARRYSELFPFSTSKLRIIPPLVKFNNDISSDIRIFEPDNNKIILSYFGVLYRAIRTPEGILNLLKAVYERDKELADKVEMHFFGDHSSCSDIFEKYPSLRKVIFFHGMVTQNIANTAMSRSDVLVNIGNGTSYQLPSKIVEYVAAMKPIINVTSIESDSTKNYLKEFNFVINYYTYKENNIDDMLMFIKGASQVQIKRSQVEGFLNAHEPEVIAGQYLNALSK